MQNRTISKNIFLKQIRYYNGIMVFVGALTHVLQKNSDLNKNTQCLY